MNNQALIFANLLNGVPEQQVAEVFKISREEVQRSFAFVLRKVKSYIFLRQAPHWKHYEKGGPLEGAPVMAYPTITGSTLDEAKKHRLTCLSVLPKLKLDKEPQFKDIQTEIVTPDNAMQIARNLA
jgi:hypothetical protein